MSTPDPPFSLPVVLLQLLDGAGRLTPAELNARLVDELPEYAALKPSSVYRALGALRRHGWADGVEGTASGKGRPPIRFSLTEPGRAAAAEQRALAARLFGPKTGP